MGERRPSLAPYWLPIENVASTLLIRSDQTLESKLSAVACERRPGPTPRPRQAKPRSIRGSSSFSPTSLQSAGYARWPWGRRSTNDPPVYCCHLSKSEIGEEWTSGFPELTYPERPSPPYDAAVCGQVMVLEFACFSVLQKRLVSCDTPLRRKQNREPV